MFVGGVSPLPRDVLLPSSATLPGAVPVSPFAQFVYKEPRKDEIDVGVELQNVDLQGASDACKTRLLECCRKLVAKTLAVMPNRVRTGFVEETNESTTWLLARITAPPNRPERVTEVQHVLLGVSGEEVHEEIARQLQNTQGIAKQGLMPTAGDLIIGNVGCPLKDGFTRRA